MHEIPAAEVENSPEAIDFRFRDELRNRDETVFVKTLNLFRIKQAPLHAWRKLG